MSTSRVAVWVIVVAAGGAWLASAAGVVRQARATGPTPAGADVVQFDALAADVQAQAGRLQERLATAPSPRMGDRNPFNFAARSERRSVAAHAPAPAAFPAPAPEVREPALDLIGLAESTTADVVVRTAMITGGYGELMMVTVGQRILGRYDVTAVGADAVELKDLQTGETRRLALK